MRAAMPHLHSQDASACAGRSRAPERASVGFTYKVFGLEDGVSFVHVVIEHDVDHPGSLQAMPAFQAFVAGIGDRCDVAPVAKGATIIGGYR